MNLWGPMIRMSNAASAQAIEIFKERLREFLESSDTGRQAMAMSGTKASVRYVILFHPFRVREKHVY